MDNCQDNTKVKSIHNIDNALSQAKTLFSEGDLDKVEIICSHLFNTKVHDPRIYNLLGLVAHKRGDTEKAARKWFDGSVLFPNNPVLHFNIGAALIGHYSHKLRAQARKHLRIAVRLQPDWVDALFFLGDTCMSIGPPEEAVEAFQRVIQLAPDNLNARKKLAEVSARLDDLEETKIQLDYIATSTERVTPNIYKDVVDATVASDKTRSRGNLARYPSSSSSIKQDFRQAIIDSVLPGHLGAGRFISSETRFFTLGSCFARHIAGAIDRKGHRVCRMPLDESINTTFANRYFLERLAEYPTDERVLERIEELINRAGMNLEILSTELACADVVILTLGVAPCFFERGTNRFIMPRPSAINHLALAEKYQFRTSTVTENVTNLLAIVSAIRTLNISARIFLTLSPVPLRGSFEFESAVTADCLSKSVLRVATQEVLTKKPERVYYWPSFEIVRWMGAHAGPTYGEDDNSTLHVNEDLVSMIVDLFIEVHQAPLT